MIAGRRTRWITRRPTAPPCEGIRAPTLDALLAALADRGVVSPVFADLSIGAFRSHEVARSCFGHRARWRLALPRRWRTTARAAFGMDRRRYDAGEANSAGRNADWRLDRRGGRGDTVTLQSLAGRGVARALDAPAPLSAGRSLALVVLAPRFACRRPGCPR
jgi:hypothetical protein